MTRARDLADLASSGVIEGTEVADDAITYAKIQNVSADERILGRVSGADGVIEELTKAQMLTMMNVADGSNAYTHPNHSGEVTSTNDGATVVVDNIIDEANLKISNAGSNGEYLQKQSGNTGGLTWAAASSVGGATGVDFNDNVKARFGTGNDLEIYHDASNSYIKDGGTGNLKILGDSIDLYNAAGDERYIQAATDSALTLYYNGNAKLATTNTGVTVTGVMAATTLTGDGSALTGISAGAALTGSENDNLTTVTGANAIQGEARLRYDGDVLWQEANGSTTEFRQTADGAGTYWSSLIASASDVKLYTRTASPLIFGINNSEVMRIAADGRGLSQFTAKAWAYFEDNSGSDFDSHNISSVTINQTGRYTANFSNNMGNEHYCVMVFSEDGSGYNDEIYAHHDTSDTRSVSAYAFWNGQAVANQTNSINIMVFGD